MLTHVRGTGMLRMKRRMLALVLVVASVVVVAGASVYVLTRPIPLTIQDGSTTGTIEGDLASLSSFAPLVLNFTATTYANQASHPGSTLVMQVETGSAFVGGSEGFLEMNIFVGVLGHFASNLHPSGLQLTVNATGGSADAVYFEGGVPGTPADANVSFDTHQVLGVFGTGSGQVTATPVNEDAATYYDFALGAGFVAYEYLSHSQFIGFRITVTGPFTPSISVGIVLAIIDVPA